MPNDRPYTDADVETVAEAIDYVADESMSNAAEQRVTRAVLGLLTAGEDT